MDVAPVTAAAAAPPERVVVVGAGPAGMATAIELAQRGIPSVVLEKRGAVATRENLFNVSAPMADRLAALDPDGSLTRLLVPTDSVLSIDDTDRTRSQRHYDGQLQPDPDRSRGDMSSLLRASSPRRPDADHRRWSKVGIGDLENGLRELATRRYGSLVELRPDSPVQEVRQGDGWAEAILAGAAGAAAGEAVRGAMLVDASGADLAGGPRTVFPEMSHWAGGRFEPPPDGSTAIVRRRLAPTHDGGHAPLTVTLPTADRTFVWTQVADEVATRSDEDRTAILQQRAQALGINAGLAQPPRTAPVTVQLWTSNEPARGRVLKVGDSLRAPYFLTSTGAAAALAHDAPRAVDAIEQVLAGTPVEDAVGAYADAVRGANELLLGLARSSLLADLGVDPAAAGEPRVVVHPPAGSAASPQGA